MTSTNTHPDDITSPVLDRIERQVSEEIATTVVTTAFLDGSARQRRDLRILARRLNGIVAVHGVTLGQAIAQAQREDRPMVVTLDVVDVVIEPVAVETPAESVPEVETAAVPSTDAASGLVVTRRGHFYRLGDPRHAFLNDTVCRGCGHTGHFDYILDYKPCSNPFTGAGVELGEVA